MVVARIQVIVTEAERERLRSIAEREGLSLSAWLRKLGIERATALTEQTRIDSVAALDRFFRDCDKRESAEREPEWDEHLRVMDSSRGSGRSGT